jgi:succinate-semialdehyde dehydrogenase/glutarate-semialdehyde dehydrogenase
MRQCADTVKKLSLELGGNAPFIVFDDADVDAAVVGAIQAKFRNAGQTCVCANRIYVQEGIYESFVEKFAKAVAGQTVGDGMEEGVTIGPLINDAALGKVERLVEDALSRGATTVVGGERAGGSGAGCFYEPTVLRDVNESMSLQHEEIFGPIAAVYSFASESEAIAKANDTRFGLAAYFYGRDVARVWRVAEALEFGMVGINTGSISTAEAPFGGVKESGLGREGSKYGVEEFVEIKYLCFGGIDGGV